ncbi:MAG TPA: hypothetical protein DDY78_13275 [Planctomycetales bacterium]|jgi:transposase|nr:hypothetical protein [Planctomycetales bacterium]
MEGRTNLVSAWQGCLAELEAEVRDLKARLGLNSSNLPPSANPPSAPPPVSKKPSGRKAGGQPGHPGPVLLRLPRHRVAKVVPFVPTTCSACHAALPAEPSPADALFCQRPLARLIVEESVTDLTPLCRQCALRYYMQCGLCLDCIHTILGQNDDGEW